MKTVVRRGQAVRLSDLPVSDLLVSKFDLSDADARQHWVEKRSPPPPLIPLRPMICYSEPKDLAELKEYTKECSHPAGPAQAIGSISPTNQL
jgi:hypothetical protein